MEYSQLPNPLIKSNEITIFINYLQLFLIISIYTAGATPDVIPVIPATSATPVTEPSIPPVTIHTERKFFPPKRPDLGKLGRKIPLLVNYFPLEIRGGEIIQYDVKVFTEEMVARKG